MVDRSQQTCSVVDLRLIMRQARSYWQRIFPIFMLLTHLFFTFPLLFLASQIDIFFIQHTREVENGGIGVYKKPQNRRKKIIPNRKKIQSNPAKPSNPINFHIPVTKPQSIRRSGDKRSMQRFRASSRLREAHNCRSDRSSKVYVCNLPLEI